MQKKSQQQLQREAQTVTLLKYDREGNLVRKIKRSRFHANLIVQNTPGFIIEGEKPKKRESEPVNELPAEDEVAPRLIDMSPEKAKNLLRVTMDPKVIAEGLRDTRKSVSSAAKSRAEELNL